MSAYRTEILKNGEPCWWCEMDALYAELDAQGDDPDPSAVADLAEAQRHWDLEMKKPTVEVPETPAVRAVLNSVFGDSAADSSADEADSASGSPTG